MTTAGSTRSGAEAAPTAPDPMRWRLIVASSRAAFAVHDKLVTTVRGTLPIEDGAVAINADGEVIEAWVTLSTAGISTGNAHRDRDLLKPRFLDAQHCPVVWIGTEAPVETTRDGATAQATVRARGASAPVALSVSRVPQPRADTEIRMRVTGRLDRTPLAIKVPTFVVGRYLDLEADLTFRREGATTSDRR